MSPLTTWKTGRLSLLIVSLKMQYQIATYGTTLAPVVSGGQRNGHQDVLLTSMGRTLVIINNCVQTYSVAH